MLNFDATEYRAWMESRNVSVNEIMADTGLHLTTIYRCLNGGGNRSTKMAMLRYRNERERGLVAAG